MAVKAFRLDLLPEDVARLADGLRRLVGTAGYLAAGLEGTTAYVAMDYHAAETLDVALRHLAPAPLETALPILRALAAEIDRASTVGPAYGHGALHPRDVFLTPGTDALHVTGFGIAPALEAIGARPPVRRPYTAPERATGESWDVRADVFSLGAIAHELLTARRPAGPGEQDGSLPTSLAPEARVRIRRVLSKALAESPDLRFATAGQFIDALADPSTLIEVGPPSVPLPVAAVREPLPLVATAAPVLDELLLTDSVAPTPEPTVDVAAMPAVPAVASVVLESPVAAPAVAPRRPKQLVDISDVPLRPEPALRPEVELPLRGVAPASSLALPPPFPWVAMGAVVVASLILGAVGGFHYALRRAPSPTVASVSEKTTRSVAPPVTPAPAPNDTEVAITSEPAARPPVPAVSAAAPPAGKSTPTQAPGRIVVRTTPAGAAVTIDGRPVGRSPLTARNLSLSTHTVVVTRPGFASETRRVALTRRSPSSSLTVTLKAERSAPAAKAATSGSINVDSRPRGARVTIDGRAVGATPFSASGFAPGAHTVRVELAGHTPVTTTVTVKAGETARVAVTLEQR